MQDYGNEDCPYCKVARNQGKHDASCRLKSVDGLDLTELYERIKYLEQQVSNLRMKVH